MHLRTTATLLAAALLGCGGAHETGAGGSSTGTGATGGAGTGSGTGSHGGAGGACVDACPAPKGGVTWGCEKRFMFGTNWAWRNWGGDFGGVAAWGSDGVSAASAAVDADMKAMKAGGVSVIRWWMWPRFLTESIPFGADGAPSGVGGSLLADVEEALALAEKNDLYLMLTPFSFDNFGPTAEEEGILSRSIRPMVVDPVLRQKLLDNLIRPVAAAVEKSPHRDRVLAWDLINEPEWATSGPDLHGGEDFTPNDDLESVTHAEMEAFLKDLVAALRGSSRALITVGSAAIKWAPAWTTLGLDFYQLHYYDWVHQWYPYTSVTLASAGLDDRPVVMGEFPVNGLSAAGSSPARTLPELAQDLWEHGYAGALSWAYDDSAFPWSAAPHQAFAAQHACEARY